MDQHALLMYTLVRHTHVDSPEHARRREQLLRLEREALAARRRRRHDRLRRVWSARPGGGRDAAGGMDGRAAGTARPASPR
jgi:hypothetical protein